MITVDKKGRHNSIKGLNEIARRINDQGRPDIVINLHPNERTSYLAWKIHGKVTTGMSHFLFRPFMTKYTRLDRKTRHAADMYINVLEQLGVTDVANHGLHIETSKEWNDEVFRFYKAKALCLVIRLLVLILAVQCLKTMARRAFCGCSRLFWQ